ncbi:OpgC family protein [Aureimonas leprariae]|nr:OpgC domain-containing protein [Aureimonas leprariae]
MQPKPERDHRVDFFRGIALAMIFVNHVPGNVWESFTTRNFGFSDSAELFVFLAGYASTFAYAKPFLAGHRLVATLKAWRRAGVLYLVHATLTLFAVGLFAWAAMTFGNGEFVRFNDMQALMDRPLDTLFGLAVMAHQLKFVNILPMYVAMLAMLPALLWAVERFGRRGMLLASALLWALAANFWLNIPNHPYDGGWFFDPFAWQFIFAIGLYCGLLRREGRQAVPYSRRLYRAALGYLALSLLFIDFDLFGKEKLIGLPDMLVGFDKTYVSLPRLVHLLALVYVFAYAPAASVFSRVSRDNPLTRLGRHSLPVFATGTALALVIQVVMFQEEMHVLRDTALIGGGLLIQFALAVYLDWWGKAQRLDLSAAAAPRQARPVRQSGGAMPALARAGAVVSPAKS